MWQNWTAEAIICANNLVSFWHREFWWSVSAELLVGAWTLSIANRHHFKLNLAGLLGKSAQCKRNWFLNVLAGRQRCKPQQANFDGIQAISLHASSQLQTDQMDDHWHTSSLVASTLCPQPCLFQCPIFLAPSQSPSNWDQRCLFFRWRWHLQSHLNGSSIHWHFKQPWCLHGPATPTQTSNDSVETAPTNRQINHSKMQHDENVTMWLEPLWCLPRFSPCSHSLTNWACLSSLPSSVSENNQQENLSTFLSITMGGLLSNPSNSWGPQTQNSSLIFLTQRNSLENFAAAKLALSATPTRIKFRTFLCLLTLPGLKWNRKHLMIWLQMGVPMPPMMFVSPTTLLEPMAKPIRSASIVRRPTSQLSRSLSDPSVTPGSRKWPSARGSTSSSPNTNGTFSPRSSCRSSTT